MQAPGQRLLRASFLVQMASTRAIRASRRKKRVQDPRATQVLRAT